MKRVFHMGLAVAAGFSPARAATDGTYHHNVAGGQRSQIGLERSWSEDCRSTGAKITVTDRPRHGALTIDHVPSQIPERDDGCAGRSAMATRVLFTAQRGFQGEDHVGWDVAFGNGQARHVDVSLTIVPAFITAHEGEVFRAVPAPRSLNGTFPGMSVFIDDGSCPAGQIKRMTIGDPREEHPRSFSCAGR